MLETSASGAKLTSQPMYERKSYLQVIEPLSGYNVALVCHVGKPISMFSESLIALRRNDS